MVQDINGLGSKTIDYQYDPITGQVRKVYYQKELPSERFIHRYDYNIVDQLTNVAPSIDDKTFNMRAQYTYYETGALKRTELAGGGVQGIDYAYNLAGQLKAINPSGESSDLFGMQIDYHSSDYKRAVNNIQTATYGKDRYNGTIKGIRWQNKGASDQEAVYAYRYNRNNWLESADYGADGIPETDTTEPLQLADVTVATGQSKTYENPNSISISPDSHFEWGSTVLLRIAGGAPSGPAGEYDVHNIGYDANGNIEHLIRNKNNADDGPAMDDLTYAYATADAQDGPNQLRKITDPAGKVAGADDIGDQLGDALGANYHYNKIGQLVADWKHVSPEERKTYIENGTLPSSILTYSYNAGGLVTQVKKNNVPLVKFFYNDRNHRVKKETYGGINGDKILSTHYVRDVGGQVMAIYMEPQNGTPKVAEYPVYGSGRIGVYKPGGTPKTLYELTDHLGNLRTVFSVTDTNSGLINEGYSDYYPFGMQMPGRNMVGDYRYAFQGQEKDDETGKEAFELRLWDSRIGRWLTKDPAGQYSSPYLGMGNNPISRVDPDGGFDVYQEQEDGSFKWVRASDDVVFLDRDGNEIGITDISFGLDGVQLGERYGEAIRNIYQSGEVSSNDLDFVSAMVLGQDVQLLREASEIAGPGSKVIGLNALSLFNSSKKAGTTLKAGKLVFDKNSKEALKRLGVLDFFVGIKDGAANVNIGFLHKFNRGDFRTVENALLANGATKIRVTSGISVHPDIVKALNKRDSFAGFEITSGWRAWITGNRYVLTKSLK